MRTVRGARATIRSAEANDLTARRRVAIAAPVTNELCHDSCPFAGEAQPGETGREEEEDSRRAFCPSTRWDHLTLEISTFVICRCDLIELCREHPHAIYRFFITWRYALHREHLPGGG